MSELFRWSPARGQWPAVAVVGATAVAFAWALVQAVVAFSRGYRGTDG